MYGKLVTLFALASVALAREYPAGLHPSVCPDYPNCDPSVFARFTPGGIPIPEWGFPGTAYYRSAAPVAPQALPADANVAARYPADFNPALCPNYPYCW